MIIPLPFKWGRQTAMEPQDQIDRVVHNRNYRLIAGLSVERPFEQVSGVLLISVGNGKFIRCRHLVEASFPIPKALKKSCLEILNVQNQDLGSFYSLLADLAAIQAQVVDRLKIEAGKYVDRILAVSVVDPGLWRTDFDGRPTYASFCDAARLAELCGITVIDNFPAADLAAGGNGQPLDALPFWLLAADRNAKIAERDKFVLQFGSRSQPPSLLKLPVSDGLDSELPELEYWQFAEDRFAPWSLDSSPRPASQDQQQSPASSVESLIRAIQPILERALEKQSFESPIEVICVGPPESTDAMLQQIQEISPAVESSPVFRLGVSPASVPACLAALLGLMHIDQLPANLPWLTGANSQRILGRLTLGRPSNWRQLVRVMADYQPAAMKLKDAV